MTRHRTAVLGWLLILALAGCSRAPEAAAQAEPDAAAAAAPTAPSSPGKLHTLTIYGYNYTNRYIDQFSVNGQGGSNLDLSTPTAGGGKEPAASAGATARGCRSRCACAGWRTIAWRR